MYAWLKRSATVFRLLFINNLLAAGSITSVTALAALYAPGYWETYFSCGIFIPANGEPVYFNTILHPIDG